MPAPGRPAESWLEQLWYAPVPGGPLALLLPLLRLLAKGFGALARARAALYDRGWLRGARPPARVISVGNLNVGGSGKTPVVIFLAERLLAAGKRVAVLSRGYGGHLAEGVVSDGQAVRLSAREAGDEPVLVARRVPGAVVLVGKKRARIAERAVREFGAEVLLLDDGFQHRALARDEDILVLGGRAPLGNGELMPAGPLREPPSAGSRATLLWLSNVDEEEGLPSGLPGRRVRTRSQAVDVTDWHGRESLGRDALRGQKVLILCGLARPSGFARTLAELGAEVVGAELYGDHHTFTVPELARAAAEAQRLGAACIATTEKDAVRMEKFRSLPVPVRVVRLELELLEGEDVLGEVIAW